MAAPTIPSIDIRDCSGGVNDRYPVRIAENQVADAWNVEFWDGLVCGRRNGTLNVGSGGLAGQLNAGMAVYTPTPNRADDKLVVAIETTGGISWYDQTYTQVGLTLSPDDHFDFSKGVDFANLHGKLFIAAKSDVDRLHVYDPAMFIVRRVGIAQSPPPTFIGFVGSGTAIKDNRLYRQRWCRASGSPVKTTERSEPSVVLPVVVSGVGTANAIRIAGAVASGAENNTHWELEEQGADGNWYRIAGPLANATTFYDDTIPTLSAVATSGVLSDDIGDNQPPYSAKYLTVDQDRLLLGDSHVDPKLSARVAWTPLGSDSGVGNDERLPFDVASFLDFDTLDSGGLTGIRAFEGKVIVFKRSQTHQMVRTNSRLRAYLSDVLSRRHGGLPSSFIEGTDINEQSCLYFLDFTVGPMQLGARGLRVLAAQVQQTWTTSLNPNALQLCNGAFNARKRQVWWHIATASNSYPNRRWMYSVETDGIVFHTLPSVVRAAVPFKDQPHLLLNNPDGQRIVRADEPGRTTDWSTAGGVQTTYRAYIRTRAFQPGGMLRRFQVASGVVEASAERGTAIFVTCVRDFGEETRAISVPLTPTSALATLFTAPIDNLYLSEAISMQFEIGDDVARNVPAWQIHGVTFAIGLGSPSTGRG